MVAKALVKGLDERAILVNLVVRFCGFRRTDKEVSREVEENYKAERAGRYVKRLIDKEVIDEMAQVSRAARAYHKFNTLPWGDSGARILPAENFLTYTKAMREFKEAFNKKVTEFCAKYKEHVEDSEKKLGKLFKREEYPDVKEIKNRYSIEYEVTPIPRGTDFRVNLSKGDIDDLRREIEGRVKEAEQNAIRDLWNRLFEPIVHMVEKLKDPEEKFKDSLVGNIVEMVEIIPRMNLTGDKELEKIRREIESKLCSLDPKQLRKDEKFRKESAKAADDIMKKMAGFMKK